MDGSKIVFAIFLLSITVILIRFRNKIGEGNLKTIVTVAGIIPIGRAVFIFLNPEPEPTCTCQSASDDDTIRCLIAAESRAANTEDLALIEQIFTTNATIYRGSDPTQTWNGADAYYQAAYQDLDFSGAAHVDIRPVGVEAQTAYYTSGSTGIYTSADGVTKSYKNLNPSEHWTLTRNGQGCWQITRFEFNAAHITPFPPAQDEQ